MHGSRILVVFAAAVLALVAFSPSPTDAGQATTGYKVLAPISHGNLTIFPVVAGASEDTKAFLTLDEGLRSGEVVVTEGGRVPPPLIRRPQPRSPIPLPPYRGDGAQVNRLVLVNNSKRPLLLLAGEIVTGGKQDRVIAKDRIVPAESDPIDLSVFCVEPGRWTARSSKFSGWFSGLAQPSVRAQAMGTKDQQRVWQSVGEARVAAEAGVGGGVVGGTTSYAQVMGSEQVSRKLDEIAGPVERDYDRFIRELRDRNAVGVVVAIDGEITWADVFASTDLLQRYWPKLVRSYAAEALGHSRTSANASIKDAQAFIDNLQGTHEVAETEPAVYRHVEITGRDFKVFELTSLLPKLNFGVHLAKMAD